LILHKHSDDRYDDGGHEDSISLEELGAKQANMSKLAIVKKIYQKSEEKPNEYYIGKGVEKK
jgi:hypothetical protein